MTTERPAPNSIRAGADTTVLSADLEERLRSAAGDPGRRVVLIVEAGERVELVPLRPGASLVVGREPPSDLVIADRSLSRRHARFEQVDGDVFVEDLGSTNGTCVGNERVQRSQIRPGDVVLLGTVLVAVQGPLRSAEPTSPWMGHDEFTRELELEVRRAKYFGRPVTLAMFDPWTIDGSIELRTVLDARLRPVDRHGHFGGSKVEVVLPEVDESQAEVLLRDALGDKFEEATVGFASFPRAATSAPELVAAVGSALRRASAGKPAHASPLGAPGVVPAERSSVVVSPAVRALYRLVERLASSQIPVLIQGETGTGKEVLARAIVAASPRRGRPLITVNCGAIPSQLVESTLFGHDKGAFTGANQLHKGVFEAAEGGTVFLDEIGGLPLAAQSALLRVLSDRTIVRVGSTREVPVDVRLLCATHRDLEAMVEEETFREDLFYRLNTMTLTLPPLRERPEEIRPMCERFIDDANRDHGRSIRGLSDRALEALEAHDFPGNVRELKNAIERAVVIAEGARVEIGDLPDRIQRSAAVTVVTRGGPSDASAAETKLPDGSPDLKSQLSRMEADLILRALDEAGGNQSEAARRLRIPRRTLVHKIEALGIKRGGYGRRE